MAVVNERCPENMIKDDESDDAPGQWNMIEQLRRPQRRQQQRRFVETALVDA